jgi:DNA (cytosine-5)-methyltransferase 1
MAHLRTFHLFAGAGGGILADLLLGHIPVGACEIEPYPRNVLLARQRDGILPKFPIWDDVCTLDGKPWRGSVDLLCGGFPCQDISAAGKGAGITGERSGLWKEYARLIGEMRPRFVFAENSPLLRTRGLGVVLEDLAALGYNARWGVLGARDVGAPHKRDRMWVLAYAMHQRLQGDQCARGLDSQGRQESDGSTSECGSLWWHTDPAESPTEPIVGRVAHGVAHRVDRLKAIGNGQVSQCATMAFSILSEGLI